MKLYQGRGSEEREWGNKTNRESEIQIQEQVKSEIKGKATVLEKHRRNRWKGKHWNKGNDKVVLGDYQLNVSS